MIEVGIANKIYDRIFIEGCDYQEAHTYIQDILLESIRDKSNKDILDLWISLIKEHYGKQVEGGSSETF